MAHNTTRPLRKGEIDELLEAEKEDIVCSHHQQIVINLQLIHCIQEVTHGTQTRFVGRSTVIDNCDRLRIVLLCSPLLEDGGKLMIRDDDVLVDLRNLIYIIQHPPEDRALADLQQRFRKVLGQFTQTSCITGCYNNVFHDMSFQPSALSFQLVDYFSLLLLATPTFS